MRRGSTYFDVEPNTQDFVHVYIDFKVIDRQATDVAFPDMTDDECKIALCNANPGIFTSISRMITKRGMYDMRNVWPRIFDTNPEFHGLPGNVSVRSFMRADTFSGTTPIFTSQPVLSSYNFVTRDLNNQWINAGTWQQSISIGPGERYDMVGMAMPSAYEAQQYGLSGYYYYYDITSDYLPGTVKSGKVNGIYLG